VTEQAAAPGSYADEAGQRLLRGAEASSLQRHLEARYGIEVGQISELDLGVFRVDRRDGPNWVARLFPAVRPVAVTAGDAEILGYLGEHDLPVEHAADPEPVSVLNDQAVLVTEHVQPVPRQQRQATVRDLGGLRSLGDILGRLHRLPEGTAAVTRPGGAWHHLADGSPRDEIATAAGQLADAESLVPAGMEPAYAALHQAIDSLDDGGDLPQALVHPDYVLANVVASPDRGLVVVDWAGAGRAARLWSLAWFLFAEGAKDLRRIDRVIAGYGRHVQLEPEELSRLAAIAPARRVVLESWAFALGRKSLADAAREVLAARQLGEAVADRTRAVVTAGS
jgi:Ser/Thr protein kinase RdoA (MazF antagonist)